MADNNIYETSPGSYSNLPSVQGGAHPVLPSAMMGSLPPTVWTPANSGGEANYQRVQGILDRMTNAAPVEIDPRTGLDLQPRSVRPQPKPKQAAEHWPIGRGGYAASDAEYKKYLTQEGYDGHTSAVFDKKHLGQNPAPPEKKAAQPAARQPAPPSYGPPRPASIGMGDVRLSEGRLTPEEAVRRLQSQAYDYSPLLRMVGSGSGRLGDAAMVLPNTIDANARAFATPLPPSYNWGGFR